MADIKNYISIKGARVHNLKNISLDIPQNKLVVITGLSGSGKSSLAFDTLFAEGQRRYVESLSSYARQFLGRINKPDVDSIDGIAPAIAIEQKVSSRNPRSTVGTTTEIYDYLKLLFSRIGRIYSPTTGLEVKLYQPSDIVDEIQKLKIGTNLIIAAQVSLDEGQSIIEKITLMVQQGFDRYIYNGVVTPLKELMADIDKLQASDILIAIDRVTVSKANDELLARLNDSVQIAMTEGKGSVVLAILNKNKTVAKEHIYSSMLNSSDGEFMYITPSEHLFSFNSPLGACPKCEGYGRVVGIDENLVIPNKGRSVFEGAVACWSGETMKQWKEQVINAADKSGFPIHRPYEALSQEHRDMLWKGCRYFEGINTFFSFLESERYKIQYRVLLSRYTGKTVCPKCHGGRLREEAMCVKVSGYNITQLVCLTVLELGSAIEGFKLSQSDITIAKRILTEITSRLEYLKDVGLGYLTLDRLSNSLSGGESQRINLATQLGSALVGSMYILDEPSIGLHPRDTERLIGVLKNLRDLGNTVIVVEHDKEIMEHADWIIDIGPGAGVNGGNVVFEGTQAQLAKASGSLTADYLTGKSQIAIPKRRRKSNNYIELKGVRENNLKAVDVKFPLGVLTCVTGVSGSGKSSLVKGVLYPVLHRYFNQAGPQVTSYDSLNGDLSLLGGVEMVDQNPIGRSSRSNPVTYIKAYDEIRKLFSEQQAAKIAGLTPSSFSFNIAGGRCEECQGDGVIKVEMQFMADIEMVCEHCGGRRFKEEVLEVRYGGCSIDQVLDMSVSGAIEFFSKDKSSVAERVVSKLSALENVGLGYISLGQSSSTLSGGESQRVKLASFMLKDSTTQPLIFIFDEPTTGLHFHDISKLLDAFNSLIDRGHTIVVVEHNMDVVKCADYLIDLGAEGGSAGGNIVAVGTPQQVAQSGLGYTSKFIAEKFVTSK